MLPKHLSRFPVARILLFSGLALCGSALKADLIYSNFGTGFAYADGAGVIVSNGSLDYSVAEAFTPTANYDLSSIEFVATTNTTPTPSNSVSVSIYADNGGVPAATALETITLGGQLTPFGSLSPILTATSALMPELSTGAQYWLVMDGSPSENLIWDNNSTLAQGYLETNGTAGDWVNSPNPFASETNGVFEIDGTLVSAPAPEPRTWMLLAGGLGLMSVLARRRSKNAA